MSSSELPVVELPAIYRRYPALQKKLHWVSLTCGPTPVESLSLLGKELGFTSLWVKRDDLCGQWYGGNKPRKLEFLLAEAKAKGAASVFTLGALGSHHTLATAVYCYQLGLHSVLGLANRPLGEREKPNLESSHALGAEMFYVPHDFHILWRLPMKWLHIALRDLKLPYFIPPGGSSALGCLGYVSAAFELAEQIEKGQAVSPDEIWLPVGSLGTMVGLVLGLYLAGLRCKVVGVKIYPSSRIGKKGVMSLIVKTHCLLKKHLPDLPNLKITDNDFSVIEGYIGEGYAHTTDAAESAISLMQEMQNIGLEHVYTGKCMAALVDAAKEGSLNGKRVMFWNTYNSLPYQQRLPSVTKKLQVKGIEGI
jgi:D-cysteine desulfhydrase